MKRIIGIFMALTMLFTTAAFAELPDIKNLTDEELVNLIESIKTEQEARGVATQEEEPFELLQKGSKGDNVKKLQKRLIELNYLEGEADGDFGNKTVAALKLFQTAAALEANGIADEATQKALFDENAEPAKVYLSLNYNDLERDPNSYVGKNYKFTGKIFQLVGEEDLTEYDDDVLTQAGYGDKIGTVRTVLMISVNGSSNKLAYVEYFRPKNNPRILEDDQVTVYASFDGLYTYETVRGSSNTILQFTADTIS